LFAARRLRNWSEAEDVAQEAIRRALESLRAGRVEKPEAISAFLFQTALHICQHRSLSAGRQARAFQRLASDSRDDGAEPGDPLQAMLTQERREAVQRGLERLDSGDRDILTMTYVDTLEAAEIGRRLGLSPGNVRVRRHRALSRLSELLDVTSGPEKGLKS